ncbi:xanthine dehydrogenase family Fe-S subunit [Pseudohoeflea suaedae]
MVQITINDRQVSGECEPRTHLADFLREAENLTGTHLGCEHGVCGACTVLVDGVPTRSCITFAHACEGARVTTIEGLDEDEIAAELRTALSKEHGLQCGYCTPGMVVSARDIVLRMEAPSEHDIRVALSGNLCRCTGYVGIVRAVQSVIEARRARGIAAVPGGGRDRLGPAGSGHAGAVQENKRERAAPAEAAAATRAAQVSRDDNWRPQTTLEDSFTVSHPPEVVWDFFGRVEEVAACLPGASLQGAAEDGHVEGQIKVKVGPISAEFQGVADITRDETAKAGTIDGAGKDKRSNSATRGRIRYVVREGDRPGETLVELSIGYTLSGVLAQFSRSGLVQDVAGRLIAVFVQNLEARLNHEAGGGTKETAPESAALDAGSLMSSVVIGQIKQFFARLLGRR